MKPNLSLAGLVVLLAVAVTRAPAAGESWTLDRALAFAAENSPDARIADHRIRSARAALQQAEATWWPQVRLQSGYTWSDNPVSVFGATLNQKSFSPSLDFNDVPGTDNFNARGLVSVPLYAGGRLAAARDGARSRSVASRHDAASVRLMLGFEVTRTFLAVQRAGEFIRTAKAAVRSYEAHLAVARERVDAGTALKTEALDLEVRLAGAEEELLRARHARELAARALGNLLGFENQVVEVTGAPVQLSAPAGDDAGARPELAALRERTRAAEAELKGARSGHLPSLKAFGAVDYDYGFRNENGAASYTVGLLLDWSLWDGRLTRGRIGEASAHLDAAREEQRKLGLDLAYQVHEAKLALREAGERISVAEKAVAAAEESATLTRNRFEEGAALASQVIDAETALTAARVRHIAALTDRQTALAALRKAVGLMPLSETQPGETHE